MLVIDVYNTLQTPGVLPSHLAGIELEGLARLISTSRYAAGAALLVCDGQPHSEAIRHAETDRRFPGRYQIHGCDILFAGAGHDADSVIEKLIARDSAPARLIVVSSDRRIRKAAARRGATSLASDQFLSQLAHDQSRPRPEPYPAFAQEIPLDPYSLAHWMAEFGYEMEGAGNRAPGTGEKPKSEKPRASKPLPEGGVWGGSSSGSPKRHSPTTPSTRLTTPQPPTSNPQPPAPLLPKNADPVLSDPHITDPLLLEALRHWTGRMTPEELDMRRWLEKESWLDVDKRKRKG